MITGGQLAITFTEVYTNYYDYVYRVVRGKINDSDDTEDIVSQVFERAFKYWNTLDPYAIGGWLYTIAKNQIAFWYKSRAPSICYDDSLGLSTNGEKYLAAEEIEDLRQLIIQLPTRQRDSIVLRLQGIPDEDAADTLKIPVSAYRVYVHRAKLRLKEMVQK